MDNIIQIIIALISGMIGGMISYYYSIKQTKLAHKIALREDKFDDFTGSINWLRDMIDVVTQEVNRNVINYKDNNVLEEFKYFDMFNKIFEQGSKCSSLIMNYGKLYEVRELKFLDISEVHGLALNIAMKMDYYARHKNETFIGFEKVVEEKHNMNLKWNLLRKNLINIYDTARTTREKDLK